MIDRIFRSAVLESADFPAVIEDGTEVSYRMLGSMASQVAQLLGPYVENNPRVALLSDNDAHYVALYWGIVLCGGVSVELNPELGKFELDGQIENARPGLTLRTGRHAGPDGGLVSVDPSPQVESNLGTLLSAVLEGRTEDLHSIELGADTDQDHLASIVYTSGTTGLAKGVCLSSGNLAWTARAIAKSLNLEGPPSSERFSGNLPLYYTYGKSVLHLATLLQTPIVFTKRALSANGLFKLIAENGVTHLSLVPFQCSLLLNRSDFSAAGLPELRRITVAGGAMHEGLRNEMFRRFPGRVLPMYGLSEASTRVTCMDAGSNEVRPFSCGRPIPGVEIGICGDDGQALPAGETGEVVVRGPNVMQGYFRDAEATKTVISDDWLHSGDVGWLDQDGYLTIAGRIKDIIKIMGESVSASSIEAVIREIPQVAETAVTGIEDAKTGEAICAFVVAREEAALNADDIRQHCARQLGRARVPRHVRFLQVLPRTASGKIRKHLLTIEPTGETVHGQT